MNQNLNNLSTSIIKPMKNTKFLGLDVTMLSPL